MTTEGALGEPKLLDRRTLWISILMLNLLLHEMIHVAQKTPENTIHDKTRENGRFIMNLFMNNTRKFWTFSFFG
jgi:hypothetical protein